MKPKRVLTTTLLLCATTTLAVASPEPPPDSQVPEALRALRDELAPVSLDKALRQPRFRPLCDAEGYPLVGNLASKGTRTLPSEYCAAIRKGRAGA
jgi:hypothetical protein